MFYKTDLLIKTGGEFTIIWLLAHGKESKSRIAMNNAINELNITEKCEALQKYLPTGQLTATEVRNKMSLYLLAVLQHGIVIAFGRKTDIVLKNLNEAINKLFKPIVQKPPQKRRAQDEDGEPRKAKRTRKSNAALAPIAEDEEEGLIDLRNLPAERVSDRLRVSDIRQITLNEYDQPPQDFFEPDIRDLLNMEQMQELELGSEHSREVVDNLFSRDASRAASVNEELQSLYAELINDMGVSMAELETERHNIDELFNDVPMANASDFELPRDASEQQVQPEQMEVDADLAVDQEVRPTEIIALDPSLQLLDLTETQLREELQEQQPVFEQQPRRRRRVRILIVDDQIELTDNEIRQNLANYADIVTRRPRFEMRTRLPTVRELFDPVSVYLPSNHMLGDLLKGAAKDALDNLKRRNEPEVEPQESAAEIARRGSSATNIMDQTSLYDPNRTIPPIGRDIQTESFAEPQPIDFDQMPPPMFEPQQQDVPFDQPLESQPNAADLTYDVTMDQTMLPVMNMEPEPDHNAMTTMDAALFRRIKERQRDKANVEFMEFANTTSRKAIARDFVNMLHLLKQRAIRVEQSTAYGPILVEVIGR